MKYGVLLWCLWMCVTGSANAKPIDNETLKIVETYLNTIRSLKSEFTQIAPDGSASEGTLWIKRPGKMRWEYHPPVPIVMVTTGTYLRYYDSELEQVSDIPIQGTIASVLIKDVIRFHDSSLNILEASTKDGMAIVKIAQRGKEDEGAITFECELHPTKLRAIIMKDAKGDETHIALNNAELNMPAKNSLFEMYDPRFKRKGYQK